MPNTVGRISRRDRKELTKQARTIRARHLRKFTCELVSQLGRCSTTNACGRRGSIGSVRYAQPLNLILTRADRAEFAGDVQQKIGGVTENVK